MSPEQKRPFDIRERTFQFANRVLDVTAALPEKPEANVVRIQLAKSATSVGANVEEADGAVTRKDKRKALVISRKEARESRYWLRLIHSKWPARINVEADIEESWELILILSSMINKLE